MILHPRFYRLWLLLLAFFAFSSPAAYALDVGNTLVTNQPLMTDDVLRSTNKVYWAIMQGDGNFVVYTKGNKVVWMTGSRTTNSRAVVQGDGNLCVYPSSGGPTWCASKRAKSVGNYFMILRDSGDLELYSGTPGNTGVAALVWTSGLDAGYYANKYADLKQAYGMDGENLMFHWLTSGRLEGRSPKNGISDEGYQHARSVNLDPKYYAEKYPDLKQAFGYDAEKLYQHWMNHGMKEARIPNHATEVLLAPPPRSANGQFVMRLGDWLRNGEYMVSDDKRYIAVLQGDANLVVYQTSTPAGASDGNRQWHQNSKSFEVGPQHKYFMRVQADGHMCTYRGTSEADQGQGINCTPYGAGGPVGRYFVELHNNGNLVVAKGNGPQDNRGWIWDHITTRPSKGFNFRAIAESVSTFVVNTANTVAGGATGAANSVAHGTAYAANELARETTNAANTVAHTAVDVANQTADIANSVLDFLRGGCSTYARYFPDPLGGMQGVTALAEVINSQHPNTASGEVLACANEFRTGYYCQIPEEVVALVKDVKAIPDVLKKSAEQSITNECVGSFALTAMGFVQAPLVCGAMKSMVEDTIKVSKCATAAARTGALQKLMASSGEGGGGSTQAQACRLAGKVSLKVAKQVLTKSIPANNPAKQLYSVLTRAGTAASSMTGLEQIAECGGSGARPVQVQAAWYGVEGRTAWDVGGKNVAVRIREGMQNGQVVIPANMNAFFGGDPTPGAAKVVAVQVVHQGKVLNLRQTEGKELRFPGTAGKDYYLVP